MTENWRWRCPEGHASIKNRPTKSYYYCDQCRQKYEGEPIDAKTGKPRPKGFSGVRI